MTIQNAHAAYQEGDYKTAETILQTLRTPENPDSSVYHLSALTAFNQQQPRAAFEYCQAALQNPTNTEQILNTLGRVFQVLGDNIRAEKAFRQSLQVAPDFSPAHTNLINHLINLGDTEKCKTELEQLRRRSAENIEVDTALSAVLLEMNQIDEALNVLSRYSTHNLQACMARAKILFETSDYDGAIAQCSKAYKSKDYAAQALQLSLQIMAMTGAWGSLAQPLISELTSLHPESEAVWAVAIRALHNGGHSEDAQKLFDAAPHEPAVLVAQAEALNLAGKFKTAEGYLREAMTQRPAFPPALVQFCLSLLGLEEYDQAQSVADIALRTSPNNQFFYAIKATAGRKKGQNYGYYFDYDKLVQPYILPVPKGWDSLEAFNAQLSKELGALHNSTNAPLDQTLRIGTQTNPNLKYVGSPAITAFFEAVKAPISEYLSAIGHDNNHPLLRFNTGKFRIRSGWSVHLHKGGHHVNHIHPEGWISSSYYVDVPKSNGREGNIMFGCPPINMGLSEEHEIQPKAGQLVLFPSYLWHGTVPITGDETRLTLPIDIMPA